MDSGVGSPHVAVVSILVKQVHNNLMLQLCETGKVRVHEYHSAMYVLYGICMHLNLLTCILVTVNN